MKYNGPQSKKLEVFTFFSQNCGLYLSPESEVALVLKGQGYFPSKVLKSKE